MHKSSDSFFSEYISTFNSELVYRFMITVDFDRPGLRPLRLQRNFHRAALPHQLLLLASVRTEAACTALYQFLADDRDWFQTRITCARLFMFFERPKAIRDPPVAIPFGPHSDPGESDSSDDDMETDDDLTDGSWWWCMHAVTAIGLYITSACPGALANLVPPAWKSFNQMGFLQDENPASKPGKTGSVCNVFPKIADVKMLTKTKVSWHSTCFKSLTWQRILETNLNLQKRFQAAPKSGVYCMI